MEEDFQQRELNEYHRIAALEENFKKLFKLYKMSLNTLKETKKSFERLKEEKRYRNSEYQKRNKEKNELTEEKKNIKISLESFSSIEKHYYNLLYFEIQIHLENKGKKKSFDNINNLVKLLSKELVIRFDLNYQDHQVPQEQQDLYSELKDIEDCIWIENQIEIEIENEKNSIVVDRSSTIKRIIEILIQKYL